MITPSNPAGALAATAGDWKVARIFSPTASACFTTSRPTFPLAPVIRIIAVSLKQQRYRKNSPRPLSRSCKQCSVSCRARLAPCLYRQQEPISLASFQDGGGNCYNNLDERFGPLFGSGIF